MKIGYPQIHIGSHDMNFLPISMPRKIGIYPDYPKFFEVKEKSAGPPPSFVTKEVKQCHKPAIREWFILFTYGESGDGL